jgi:hypothetical protein
MKDFFIHYKQYLILIIAVLLFCSCKENKQKIATQKKVIAWINKQILFPNNYHLFLGKDTMPVLQAKELFNSDYKILLYVDSTGCTSCKLNLYGWQQLIQEAESIFANKVKFLFFFQLKGNKKAIQELQFLMQTEKLNYPVLIDYEYQLNQLNKFYTQVEFQCFLLDKNNKVIAIGNPTLNPEIWELYKRQIRGEKIK